MANSGPSRGDERIPVVILCGGQGTRIRDVSEVMPKPMIPIGGRPIIWHIMKIYAFHGFTDFILCLGYKGWSIKEFFLNYNPMISDCTVTLGRHTEVELHDDFEEAHWRVTLADTGEEEMTGARVWRVRKYLEGCKRFCLTYGDGVGNVDVGALVDHHAASDAVGVVTGVRTSRGRFGELEVHGGRVTSFHEKPPLMSGRINGGFMVFDNERVWEYFSGDPDLRLEGPPLERMAADGTLGVFEHDGFWQCMDTLREYLQLNHLWDEGEAGWKIWE